MEIFIYLLIELLYYFFLGFLVASFNSSYLAYSCILLFLFSSLISLPPIMTIKIFTNRKKYFLISSIWIIVISFIIFLFRNFTKNGIINMTFHLYSILFMLIPFFSLFTLSLHKLYFSHPKSNQKLHSHSKSIGLIQKKKQLITLIVSKKMILIFFTLLFSKFLKFENLLIFIAIFDFILNIASPFISNFLLKYQN